MKAGVLPEGQPVRLRQLILNRKDPYPASCNSSSRSAQKHTDVATCEDIDIYVYVCTPMKVYCYVCVVDICMYGCTPC